MWPAALIYVLSRDQQRKALNRNWQMDRALRRKGRARHRDPSWDSR